MDNHGHGQHTMMQAHSFPDDPFEESEPLLLQRADAPRPRRRHAGLPPTASSNHDAGSQAHATPAARTPSGDAAGGRPALSQVKSIARIGRSTSASPGDSVADAAGPDDRHSQYYFDDTNDFSWDCTCGTREGDGIWLNTTDRAGLLMSALVWIVIVYSGLTMTLLAEAGHLSPPLASFYCTVCALALACHAKTGLSDPGAIPACAVPVDSASRRSELHTMCRSCRSYKPPNCHHCRVCNRCVSRMDHHCPWMNNCVGAANLKPFILFLCYTWIGSALALIIFACNYFLCRSESCEFEGVLVQLVRAMTVICIGSLLFTSSMLANVCYGIMTGSGTVDRLKRAFDNTAHEADDLPLDFADIFGIGSPLTWVLPTEPLFPDHDRVLGYSTPQRLLREGNERTSVC